MSSMNTESSMSTEPDRFGNPDVWYSDYYANMPCGKQKGVVAKLTHFTVEKSYPETAKFASVLEVGGGEGLRPTCVRPLSDDRYQPGSSGPGAAEMSECSGRRSSQSRRTGPSV